MNEITVWCKYFIAVSTIRAFSVVVQLAAQGERESLSSYLARYDGVPADASTGRPETIVSGTIEGWKRGRLSEAAW